MKKMEVEHNTGMNSQFCNICEKQKDKLLKVISKIPMELNCDVKVSFDLTLYFCEDCLKHGVEMLNKKNKNL